MTKNQFIYIITGLGLAVIFFFYYSARQAGQASDQIMKDFKRVDESLLNSDKNLDSLYNAAVRKSDSVLKAMPQKQK